MQVALQPLAEVLDRVRQAFLDTRLGTCPPFYVSRYSPAIAYCDCRPGPETSSGDGAVSVGCRAISGRLAARKPKDAPVFQCRDRRGDRLLRNPGNGGRRAEVVPVQLRGAAFPCARVWRSAARASEVSRS